MRGRTRTEIKMKQTILSPLLFECGNPGEGDSSLPKNTPRGTSPLGQKQNTFQKAEVQLVRWRFSIGAIGSLYICSLEARPTRLFKR